MIDKCIYLWKYTIQNQFNDSDTDFFVAVVTARDAIFELNIHFILFYSKLSEQY